jgi:low temperature requirement protein LtrA
LGDSEERQEEHDEEHRNERRDEEGENEREREVSPLELFFDLVFVLAVAQLTHHLVHHLTWHGALQTLVLVTAVCGVWAFTSFEISLLGIQGAWARVITVTTMGLGLFMNAAIVAAFTHSPWVFVVPMLAALAGPAVVASLKAPSKPLRRHFVRQLTWLGASAPLWVLGAVAPAEQRLWLWGPAALVDLIGAWAAHPLPGRGLKSQRLPFDTGHFIERLRLFIIILMGETVLSLGETIAEQPNHPLTLAAAFGAFLTLVSLWFAYFGRGERIAIGHASDTDNPIRAVRLGINMTYAVMAGLVALAAGSELLIEHVTDARSGVAGVLLMGGPALYLLAQAWYFRLTAETDWSVRGIGGLVLAAVAAGAYWLPPIAAIAVLTVATGILAVRLTGERSWSPRLDRPI